MNWLFQGLEQLQVVTHYMISTKILYILLIVIFVQSPDDSYLVILGWGLTQILAAILSLRSTYGAGFSLKLPSLGETLEETKLAFPFFTSRIAVASYTSATTILVGISGQQQAACFYACQQIYKIGSALPVNQVLYPYMAKTKNWRVFYIITTCSGGILSVTAITAAIYSEALLPILLGSQPPGANASLTFITFLAATVFSYFAVAFGYPALCAVNALHKANSSVIYAATINLTIILTLYLTNTLSALTAALSVLATELIVLLLRVFYLFQEKSKNR
ncbi:hypothetical protein J2T49_001747 [Pseudomonas nitroreducens]|nr:hypothetical protein [Pseudomonas nitroreducens]MCP1685808.1 hypothetical protein [Pseudomonas nitroreducens]